ncbi:response regulator transcription factor [Marinomonas posidonica]|uniref:Two component transcriptional regulator, winged helix family n=1 Tax=Marinomonas posidonica (strain CECT 7376 / NCIMB 14433 / IVIA-Po-181) TaxID=491952 RepID=F6CT24_MARPP|nr:response regulator transcription factor [Marinomonas posidonica]AEF55082.1 two component transcriptional regulator, winged helix family [Marinomonas posidonica IVIA-Po-181]
MRILVVEDTQVLGQAINERLTSLGHGVDLITDGKQADEMLRYQSVDLILLDLNLPGLSGLQLLQKLRQRDDDTPVLILTARDHIEDRIRLLDAGADDYLTKPFDFGELEARCRALLRRKQGYAANVTEHGNIQVNRDSRQVFIEGELTAITNREFRLLEIFLGHLGRVLSKDEITDHLFNFNETPGPNAIELYVGRLRKKMLKGDLVISTLRGIGYVAEITQPTKSE